VKPNTAVNQSRHPAAARTAHLELHQGTRNLCQRHEPPERSSSLEVLDLAAESIQPAPVEGQVQESEVDQHGRQESPWLRPVAPGEVVALRADRNDEERPEDRRARVPHPRQHANGHTEDDQAQGRLADRASTREAAAREARNADGTAGGFSLLPNPLGFGTARVRRRAGVAAGNLRRGFEVGLVDDPDPVAALIGTHMALDALDF